MSEIANNLVNLENQQKELKERAVEIEQRITNLEISQVGLVNIFGYLKKTILKKKLFFFKRKQLQPTMNSSQRKKVKLN